MPTLLEVQQAMHGSLVAGDDATMTKFLADPTAADRINIYRNTFRWGLTKALQLCFPVVRRLVGTEFFDGAAQHFVAQYPPREAYLNHYGADFPEFLRRFPSAASLRYLVDVASLEWAVNGALHAIDAEPLDLQKLAPLTPDEQGCQSALDRDPLSASKRDPFERRVRPVALAPSELAGVAETARARACA